MSITARHIAVVAALALGAGVFFESAAHGQFPGRGGSDGGRGPSSDRGRGPSSDRGRGPSSDRGRGGPGGGGFNSMDFLRRLDTNGNGVIDTSEMEGRARFMLERMAQDNPRISLSRPIALSTLARAMDDARRSREGGGSSRSDSSSSASAEYESLVPRFGVEMELEPVLGFGVASELFSVKVEERDRRQSDDRLRRYDRNKDGYLSREELSSGRWSDDPFQYDRNRDGKLSSSELAVRYAQRRKEDEQEREERNERMRSSRGPSSSRFADSGRGGSSDRGRGDSGRGGSSDRGRGGFSPRGSSSSGSRGSSSDRGRGGAPDTGDRVSRIAEIIFSRYDSDGDGAIRGDEMNNIRGNPSDYDKNNDKKVTKEELTAVMTERMSGISGGSFGRGGGEGGGPGGRGGFFGRGGGEDRGRGDGEDRGRGRFFGRRGGDDDGDSRGGGSSSSGSERKVVRFLTPTERLEKEEVELDEWFHRDDANGDGQVVMSEFASNWDASTINDFNQWDINRDGVITPQEFLLARDDRGAVRGSSRVYGSSRSSTGSRSSSNSSTGNSYSRRSPRTTYGSGSSSGGGTSTAAASTSTTSAASSGDGAVSAAPGGVNPAYVKYAAGVIKKYDANRDGMLSADEWKSMSQDPSSGDSDGDGKLTSEELAQFLASPK